MEKNRILVIDDQRLNIDVLFGLLEHDYELFVALNGETGLRLTGEISPDLILLDVNMPGIDGFEVCRRLKGNPRFRTIPVIFLTALDQAPDEAQGLALGAVDYISKPFNPLLVKARVASQMSSLRARKYLIETEKLAALGSLVAGMAHELNTPIGNILTAASFQVDRIQLMTQQIAAGGGIPPDLLPDLDESSNLILRNVHRATELIGNLRDVTLNHDEGLHFTFKVLEVFGNICQNLAEVLAAARCSVDISCEASTTITNNRSAFQQIFQHLILNSLRHGFPDKRPGHIFITVMTNDTDQLDIEFRDDGQGCSAEELSHLFEPFYASMRNKGGAGLGTFIIYSLVTQQLGGTIQPACPESGGLSYTISLAR